MRFRRLIAVFLVFVLCCPVYGLGESAGSEDASAAEGSAAFEDPLDQRLSALAFIAQSAPRLQGKSYFYDTKKFTVRGCAPACIVNSLIALSDITDQDTADTLLKECMNLLCNRKKPSENVMDPKYVRYLTDPDQEESPTLYALVQELPTWTYNTEECTADMIWQELSPCIGSSFLYSARYTQTKPWTNMVQLLTSLHDAGQNDAVIILTYVTGGTSGTAGPFRTDGGHYITLYFHVGRWYESGTFYLIDSLPRALKGESLRGSTYQSYYQFLRGYHTVSFR